MIYKAGHEKNIEVAMSLLPRASGLRLEDATIETGSVSLTLASTSLPASCPVRGQKTARLHSRYQRTVTDLPWGGWRVRLLLFIRKFRCAEPGCRGGFSPSAYPPWLSHTPARQCACTRSWSPVDQASGNDGESDDIPDGTYTGSQSVAKFVPGSLPEPITISPVQIVQGPPTGFTANGPQYRVIKDFGPVKPDGDKTLAASVSFPDDNGGSDNGGSDNSGSGSSGGSSGGVVASGLRGLLPSTGGGMSLTLLGAGVLMIGGGLLFRGIFR
ncbi:MAG: hypothetical protein AVDCRST_MAG14-768 [uncultured Rubrobacteraceae bacterium]|uniref:Transposase IS204/IS1001/IS1096/IS1165 zinc-finger domain-containing protein n=1 Tax=uncultured Rubrobacteraceae bacterium TaxID=349277 RepID=A0A6J4QXX7_9ACTN|nr:MAG: hypothetical protein AVDCRST_MAG14-768 [uncultured Rubrobacteraceae bacterium]